MVNTGYTDSKRISIKSITDTEICYSLAFLLIYIKTPAGQCPMRDVCLTHTMH
jgi:hypothetical protein